MAGELELIRIVPAQCELGEGPVWDGRTGSLWFTDINASELLCYHFNSDRLKRYALPDRLGSLGLTADPSQFICAFAEGIAYYRPATSESHSLWALPGAGQGLRLNDGKVDRKGKFWVGSMVESKVQAPPERGSLYRLDHADGNAPVVMFDGISISNATCFSPDNDILYFADTPSQEIVAFDLAADGSIANRRVFARLTGNAYPDGADVDTEGRVWNAEWGSGRVTAYEPDGSVFVQIDLPVSQATCIAFGGLERDLLFVTSAHEGLDHAARAAEPHAGDLLVYRTGVRGIASPIFRGSNA